MRYDPPRDFITDHAAIKLERVGLGSNTWRIHSLRHSVNALFVRGGKVLLARRRPYRAAYAGLWSFPGGHQEAGETLAEALLR
jgi:8-oxo-dGTP pyrophosphatase MutT (NUDIX family)